MLYYGYSTVFMALYGGFMAVADMSGHLILFGLGVVIILLFIVIARISAVKKMLEALEMKLTLAEPVPVAQKAVSIPKRESVALQAGSAGIPNEVIAAISAAVNQYCIENT